MSGGFQHCGVVFSVKPVGVRRWQWAVSPPTCVLGLSEETGEVDGERDDAIRAARKAIETQARMI